MIVTVAERGTTEVSPKEWGSLSADRRFWQLVDAKIIIVEASSMGRWRLSGTCYVGRALIGPVLLEIVEKFPGSFETLVGLGALKAPKTLRVSSPLSASTGSIPILVSLFIQAVRRYLSGWKKTAYRKIPDAGAIVGGRLNIARTMRLRAKGAYHQAAFDRTILSADLPFNHCIYAALREVERLSSIAKISRADVTMARALRMGLSECLAAVLSTNPRNLSQVAANEALNVHLPPEVSDVISLAGAILDSTGFGGAKTWDRSLDRAWFVNLESFFEEAVRRAVRDALAGTLTVHSARQRPSMFRPASSRYRANPDIVISGQQKASAIADAKYKDFSRWPLASDVYEIVSHASAYEAEKALMFYPANSEFVVRSFGLSATGCELWAFGITFGEFANDIRTSLKLVGLLTNPSSGNARAAPAAR